MATSTNAHHLLHFVVYLQKSSSDTYLKCSASSESDCRSASSTWTSLDTLSTPQVKSCAFHSQLFWRLQFALKKRSCWAPNMGESQLRRSADGLASFTVSMWARMLLSSWVERNYNFLQTVCFKCKCKCLTVWCLINSWVQSHQLQEQDLPSVLHLNVPTCFMPMLNHLIAVW